MFTQEAIPIWAFAFSALASTAALLTLYRNLVQRARIRLVLRRSLDAVLSSSGAASSKVHLIVTFVNTATRTGVIEEQLALELTFPDGSRRILRPNLYFRILSSTRREDESPPVPIPVPGNSGILKQIEFQSPTSFEWPRGEYRLVLTAFQAGGWTTIRATAHFVITEERQLSLYTSARIAKELGKPQFVFV